MPLNALMQQLHPLPGVTCWQAGAQFDPGGRFFSVLQQHQDIFGNGVPACQEIGELLQQKPHSPKDKIHFGRFRFQLKMAFEPDRQGISFARIRMFIQHLVDLLYDLRPEIGGPGRGAAIAIIHSGMKPPRSAVCEASPRSALMSIQAMLLMTP